MSVNRFVLALCVAGLVPAGAQAADPKAGQKLARSCVTCHGPLGISVLPNAPHLAGQPAIYLAEQMRAYRSGKRANEIMAVIAKPLTDAQIDDLAAWYSSIGIQATPPSN